MKNIPRRESVALSADKAAHRPPPVYVDVGESGVVVRATVESGGAPVDMTGRAVSFEWAHAGESGTVPCEADGESAAFELPAFASRGEVASAYLRIESADAVMTTNDMRIIAR